MKCEKVGHKSSRAAAMAKKKMQNVNLNIYKCGKCKKWHTGNAKGPKHDYRFQQHLDFLLKVS